MDNNYVLTQEGKEKLEQELHFLETEKRAEIGDRIRVAREFGDISENSEYDAAKEEQSHNESRINEIRQILATATIAAIRPAIRYIQLTSEAYMSVAAFAGFYKNSCSVCKHK